MIDDIDSVKERGAVESQKLDSLARGKSQRKRGRLLIIDIRQLGDDRSTKMRNGPDAVCEVPHLGTVLPCGEPDEIV